MAPDFYGSFEPIGCITIVFGRITRGQHRDSLSLIVAECWVVVPSFVEGLNKPTHGNQHCYGSLIRIFYRWVVEHVLRKVLKEL